MMDNPKKDLISLVTSLAGRGKDDIIQLLSREIGQAFGTVFKELLGKAMEGKKLNVTIELVPKDHKNPKPSKKKV